MIATSGFLTAVKCTKFVFGRGSARTQLGELTVFSQSHLAGLRGPTSKEEWREGRGKGERKEVGGTCPPFADS